MNNPAEANCYDRLINIVKRTKRFTGVVPEVLAMRDFQDLFFMSCLNQHTVMRNSDVKSSN